MKIVVFRLGILLRVLVTHCRRGDSCCNSGFVMQLYFGFGLERRFIFLHLEEDPVHISVGLCACGWLHHLVLCFPCCVLQSCSWIEFGDVEDAKDVGDVRYVGDVGDERDYEVGWWNEKREERREKREERKSQGKTTTLLVTMTDKLGFRSRSSSTSVISSESASSSSGHSSDTIQNQDHRYDVFISFRGSDTRNSFVDHLYSHLLRKGIFVFKDDHKLRKGESISSQLLQAIRGSRISIIVFSQDYPSSSWCLDEMATIADCKQQSNQTVFPVFYDVNPSHVRHQNGAYENAFVLHRSKFKEELNKVLRWEKAMTYLANLAGWDIGIKPEFGEIENIVQAVIQTLGHKFSGFVHDLIGIQPRVQALEDKLRLSSKTDDVQVLGIWGMGGIGKTTHAAVLYDKISHRFDASCFIEDVSKLYRDGGHTAVQKQIIHQTLGEKCLDTYSPIEISGIVRNRLHKIKVLVVLDNVNELEQLQELAINSKLLSRGSRMIIISRDEHILKVYGADVIHKVSLLNDKDARELFYTKAFKSEEQNSSCVELIPEVLKYSQCLPLAVRVIGSFLCGRNSSEWRDTLDRFENNPDNNKIMDVLQISFDGLHYMEKEIFLHIACFFKEEREDYVKRILECCGLHPHIGIPRMIEKSLITIKDQQIHMHDMLQELGKKIVRNQCPEEPESWSRIWLYEDFFHVLTTQTLDLDSDYVTQIGVRQLDLTYLCHLNSTCVQGDLTYARFISSQHGSTWATLAIPLGVAPSTTPYNVCWWEKSLSKRHTQYQQLLLVDMAHNVTWIFLEPSVTVVNTDSVFSWLDSVIAIHLNNQNSFFVSRVFTPRILYNTINKLLQSLKFLMVKTVENEFDCGYMELPYECSINGERERERLFRIGATPYTFYHANLCLSRLELTWVWVNLASPRSETLIKLGTYDVKAIVLNKKEAISEFSIDGLSKMKKLRLLILYHKSFSGSLNFLSQMLRYLLWHDYPFASLPSSFAAPGLVELNMPDSSINCLWEGRKTGHLFQWREFDFLGVHTVPRPAHDDPLLSWEQFEFGIGTSCLVLGANPFPEIVDPFCRLLLPTLFHQLEVVHLGDLMRL
ncbi:hypothetical protein V8G54_026844 [Vigna mungo]|uniref:TIR domain-containing protein n=1 Tax=Vigna mungo TaxID=3915 RepID=A0AAQ3N1C1_VIGMU